MNVFTKSFRLMALFILAVFTSCEQKTKWYEITVEDSGTLMIAKGLIYD